jgi:nucleotide-binding universal stress UspA family protein
MTAKHLLACVDFSEISVTALRQVAEYANANGSKVTMVHVTDPQSFIPPQAVLEPAAAVDPEAHKTALEGLRDEHLGGLDVNLVVLEDHAPARAICDYAKLNGVDLIVVGSHGRGGMERWLIGSVAERVVRHAESNVYVVRR